MAAADVTRPVETFATSAGPVKITPIDHASMMIEAGRKVIYVDPVSRGNYDGLPAQPDLILITDIHPDNKTWDQWSIAAIPMH